MPKKIKRVTKTEKGQRAKISARTTLNSTRTVSDQRGEVGGDQNTQTLSVRSYEYEPVILHLQKALPVQLDQYLLAKVTVGVTMPCSGDDIDGAFGKLCDLVDGYLNREIGSLPELYDNINSGLEGG